MNRNNPSRRKAHTNGGETQARSGVAGAKQPLEQGEKVTVTFQRNGVTMDEGQVSLNALQAFQGRVAAFGCGFGESLESALLMEGLPAVVSAETMRGLLAPDDGPSSVLDLEKPIQSAIGLIKMLTAALQNEWEGRSETHQWGMVGLFNLETFVTGQLLDAYRVVHVKTRESRKRAALLRECIIEAVPGLKPDGAPNGQGAKLAA